MERMWMITIIVVCFYWPGECLPFVFCGLLIASACSYHQCSHNFTEQKHQHLWQVKKKLSATLWQFLTTNLSLLFANALPPSMVKRSLAQTSTKKISLVPKEGRKIGEDGMISIRSKIPVLAMKECLRYIQSSTLVDSTSNLDLL